MLQETKLADWGDAHTGVCGNCGRNFEHMAAHIMVPGSPLGVFGCYCCWNCAKRGLLDLRTRSWFALMAITALRTGATLPIRVFPTGVQPPADQQQRVRYIPVALRKVQLVKHVRIPLIALPSISEEEPLEEPEVYEESY